MLTLLADLEGTTVAAIETALEELEVELPYNITVSLLVFSEEKKLAFNFINTDVLLEEGEIELAEAYVLDYTMNGNIVVIVGGSDDFGEVNGNELTVYELYPGADEITFTKE